MKGLGRVPNPETPLAAAAYPVTAHPAYAVSLDTYRYWFEGEAWLDQGATGTCVGNAFAHRYADAPVLHTGIDEAWARELYVAASGDTTLQEGTSALAACRVMYRRAEISAYHWITSPDEFINTLLTVGPACVGVNWYPSYDHPQVLYGSGRAYLSLDRSVAPRGGHEFVVNGINLRPVSGPPFARMKNSWGKSWPGSTYGPGTARIPLDDLWTLLFSENGDAVVVTEM
jgi:hypothetical protein